MEELIHKLKTALVTTPTVEEVATFVSYLRVIGLEAPNHATWEQAAEDILIHLNNNNSIRRHAARVVSEFEKGKAE
jgi:hypothetical protein